MPGSVPDIMTSCTEDPSILTSKLLRQGYSFEKLKTAFRKLYGRHSDLVGKYNISVSHMLQCLSDNNI